MTESLFDYLDGEDEGERALAEALDRVEAHAPDEWLVVARFHLGCLIEERRPFTSDDVFARCGRDGVEPRAMGALIRTAAHYGRIAKTGRYVESTRPAAHRRPMAEWQAT